MKIRNKTYLITTWLYHDLQCHHTAASAEYRQNVTCLLGWLSMHIRRSFYTKWTQVLQFWRTNGLCVHWWAKTLQNTWNSFEVRNWKWILSGTCSSFQSAS